MAEKFIIGRNLIKAATGPKLGTNVYLLLK